MIRLRRLAARGKRRPRTTKQLLIYPVLAFSLLLLIPAAAAQNSVDEDVAREPDAPLFSALQRVARTSALNYFSPTPALRVAPNGRMMLSYNHVVGAEVQNPYFAQYNRATRSWSTPQPIRSSGNHLRYGTFAFDSASQAHAIWLDGNDVYYAAENGWPNASRKISTSGQNIVDPPTIAIGSDGVIHVVWSQGPNLLTVYHAYLANGGSSWTISPPLTEPGDDASAVSVAATADGNVHVVWEEFTFDGTTLRSVIYYRKGTPQTTGYSWSNKAPVSLELTNAKRPALVAEVNNLHLAFTSQVSNNQQYAIYRRFAAGTWGPLVNINEDRPLSVNTSNPYDLVTSIAVCGGNAQVYFHGASQQQTSEQVWGASSGDSWQSLNPVTEAGQRHIYPTIACSNSNLSLGVDRVGALNVHDIYWGTEEKVVLLPLIRRN